MKKSLIHIFLVSFILFSASVSAQYGSRQAGLRTGYRSGIFYQMTGETGTVETGYNVMLSFRDNGIQFTGLKVVYETSLSEISPYLFFVWGYGGHLGFLYTDHIGFFGERYNFQTERFCPVIGADGWLAAEYRFLEVPLCVSLNIKPFVELTIPSFVKLMPVDLGISISYMF